MPCLGPFPVGLLPFSSLAVLKGSWIKTEKKPLIASVQISFVDF